MSLIRAVRTVKRCSRQPLLYCRLLRWGTNNAAELAAAEDANAGAQLASAHSAAPPRLLRWGTSTAADPAAVGEGNAVAQCTSVDVTRQLQTDPVSTRDTERYAAKPASHHLIWLTHYNPASLITMHGMWRALTHLCNQAACTACPVCCKPVEQC